MNPAFQKKECQIISAIIDNTDDVLRTSVSKVKAAYLSMDPDVSITPLCITVSFDGSWHKRGHTSSYGVAAVIDIYTGLVVDYMVLSKYCHACSMKKAELGPDSQLFHEWYESHKDCALITQAPQMEWRWKQPADCGQDQKSTMVYVTPDSSATVIPRHIRL